MQKRSLRVTKGHNRFVVAITGTPGAGKSRLAKLICKKCKCTGVVELSELAIKRKLLVGKDKFGSGIVDIAGLEKIMKRYIATNSGLILIVGHLAPELDIWFDMAIVVRADLKKLARRLERRKYPKEKTRENIISEAYDYCGKNMLGKATEVLEIETGKDAERLVKYVCQKSNRVYAKRQITVQIDKFGQLLDMIRSGNRYGL